MTGQKLEKNETFVVGVDGGTIKTIALAADLHGTIRGAARGGGSNWSGEDVHIPMAVVIDTVQRALQVEGLCREQVTLGTFTLAGADWPEDHVRRQHALEQAGICRRVVVKNDSFGGLRAGTSKPYGLVIAAGTGVNAAAITPDGREWAFGYYETYGGGGDIAQEAFVAVLRAEDGRGQPTALTRLVLERMDYPNIEALLRAYIAGTLDRSRFLSICPQVFYAAEAGDEAAIEIIVKQGLALAEYATAMIRRFEMQALEFDVVLAGSVFKGQGPLLVDTITQAVHRTAPRARIVKARHEPVVGSLLLSYDALGITVTDEMMANLVASLPEAELFDTTETPPSFPPYSSKMGG